MLLRVVAFLTPAMVYAPAVTNRYAYADDYHILLGAVGLGPSTTDSAIAQGRLVSVPVFQLTFGTAGSIDGLSLVRLWAIVGIGILVLFIAWLLEREGLPVGVALATGVGCGLLPTFVEYAGWATTASFPWICLVSGCAGILITTRPSLRRSVLAAFLFTLAFLTYQPAAMFLWCVVGVRLAGGLARRSVREQWLDVRRAACVTAAGVASAAVAAEVALRLSGLPLEARGHIVSIAQLSQKARLFFNTFVVVGARPFTVRAEPPLRIDGIALLVLAIMVVGLCVRSHGRVHERLLSLGLVAFTLPCAVLPNLVVADTSFDFRVACAIAPLMLILLVIAGYTLISRLRRPALQTGLQAVALTVMLIFAVLASRDQLTSTFVRPGITTAAFFRAQLAAATRTPSEVDVYIPAGGWQYRPDLGMFVLKSELPGDLKGAQVATSAVRLILAEEHRRDTATVPVQLVAEPSTSIPGTLLIDTRPLQQRLMRP